MTQENETQDVKWATIAQLEKLARNNSHDQRYQLRIMVSSEIWESGSSKSSVWVDDLSDQNSLDRGRSIMCCFRPFTLPKTMFKVNHQYKIENALIRYNNTKSLPTDAQYQIELDGKSRMMELKTVPILYRPVKLAEIPKIIKNNKEPRKFLDIAAIPVKDFGGDYPRRIEMMDETGVPFTLTLWGEDAVDENRIQQIMGKPVLIPNGLCHYFRGYEGGRVPSEWQITHARLNTMKLSAKGSSLKTLKKWYRCKRNKKISK